MSQYQVEYWLDERKIKEIEYSDYWNDETVERGKETWILDGNFIRLEGYLEKSGLKEDIQECIRILKRDFGREFVGVGADLAAGNLWASRYILGSGKVEKLYCVEYSKHRLLELGPKVLEKYKVPPEKIVLALGTFYDVLLPAQSVDFVFMGAAFHHADHPDRLLSEIRRVLKPDGLVVMIGEHQVNCVAQIGKHGVKYLAARFLGRGVQKKLFGGVVPRGSFVPSWGELKGYDSLLGDHHYTKREYRVMFERHGFAWKRVTRRAGLSDSFILVKRGAD